VRPHPALDEILDPYFLQNVVQQAIHLVGADGSGFYGWDPQRQRPTLLAVHNLPDIPWDEGLVGRLTAAPAPHRETLPGRGALLSIPVALHEELRGLLVVANYAPGRVFSQRDARMLQSLADTTAAVSRQTQRLTRMTAQFRALHTIDIALTASLQLDRVLNLILEKAVELVGAEHGSLRQLDPATGKLVLKAHYGIGWTTAVLSYSPPPGEGIVQWVTRHRRPYLSPDVRKDPHNVVLFENMLSSVAVPLQSGHADPVDADAFLGVLLLESSRLAAFDQQDVELLDALAQEAVIAIQNATQHQKLRSMHQKLKTEQEKRLAAEKWTVMGQAATSLAHRINNLIGIIPASAGEIQRVLARAAVPETDRHWIEANLERIERNARFILKLSDALFRPFKETGPPLRFDLNRLLNEALESVELPPDLELVRDFGTDLPPVESSPMLVDIFLELITNALKAMEGHSPQQLQICTRAQGDASAGWVEVEIADTGRGIPPARMERLWDIFQPSRDGLGFGLWWLRTFIERQGGAIDCRSRPGAGATFSVRLPAIAGTAD
jgi:signal transduction histidine kinase